VTNHLLHFLALDRSDPKKFQKEHGKSPWVAAFLKIAQENLQPPHVEITGTLEVTDPTADGLAHVQAALMAAEAVDPESVTVQYVGAPRYRVTVSGAQYKQVEELLKKSTEAALVKIRATGGHGSFARA